jgi:hypothetical protein
VRPREREALLGVGGTGGCSRTCGEIKGAFSQLEVRTSAAILEACQTVTTQADSLVCCRSIPHTLITNRLGAGTPNVRSFFFPFSKSYELHGVNFYTSVFTFF